MGKVEEEMKEEYYEQYKNDPDFKRFVDDFCKPRMLGIFEGLQIKIVQEYGDYLKRSRRDII